MQKAVCVRAGASMGEGSGGARGADERRSRVEFEGGLRIVVARAGGRALAVREALAGEEISWVGPTTGTLSGQGSIFVCWKVSGYVGKFRVLRSSPAEL